jgi:hypothetical protein
LYITNFWKLNSASTTSVFTAQRGRRGEQPLEVVVVAERAGVGQLGELDAVAPPQVLGEGGVDDRVVVGGAQLVARPRRPAGELDRHEHQRRAQHLLRVGRLRVVEHAEGEEERVDALLVGGEPRLLVEPAQRPVERLRNEGGLQPLVGVPLVERRRVVGGEVERQQLGLVVLRAVGVGRVDRDVGRRAG